MASQQIGMLQDDVEDDHVQLAERQFDEGLNPSLAWIVSQEPGTYEYQPNGPETDARLDDGSTHNPQQTRFSLPRGLSGTSSPQIHSQPLETEMTMQGQSENEQSEDEPESNENVESAQYMLPRELDTPETYLRPLHNQKQLRNMRKSSLRFAHQLNAASLPDHRVPPPPLPYPLRHYPQLPYPHSPLKASRFAGFSDIDIYASQDRAPGDQFMPGNAQHGRDGWDHWDSYSEKGEKNENFRFDTSKDNGCDHSKNYNDRSQRTPSVSFSARMYSDRIEEKHTRSFTVQDEGSPTTKPAEGQHNGKATANGDSLDLALAMEGNAKAAEYLMDSIKPAKPRLRLSSSIFSRFADISGIGRRVPIDDLEKDSPHKSEERLVMNELGHSPKLSLLRQIVFGNLQRLGKETTIDSSMLEKILSTCLNYLKARNLEATASGTPQRGRQQTMPWKRPPMERLTSLSVRF